MDIFLDRWLFSYFEIGKRYFLMATVMYILFYIIFKAPMMGRKIQQKFPQRAIITVTYSFVDFDWHICGG